MIGKTTARTRLCPSCANSIQEDAAKCPYCKADLLSESAPQWLNRDEPSSEPRVWSKSNKRFSLPSKFIWPGAMVVAALTAFFAGGYIQRSERVQSAQANLKQLQAKDQIIQSQEAQLAQTRQQLNDNSSQLAEIKTKLEESQKELSAMKQRLRAATREVDRLNASRSAVAVPVPGPAARRTAEPGVYETTRETSVYEGPSSASPIIAQIGRGTRINVVGSAGDWLAVRSRHGNPPGYVRADDARLIGRSN